MEREWIVVLGTEVMMRFESLEAARAAAKAEATRKDVVMQVYDLVSAFHKPEAVEIVAAES